MARSDLLLEIIQAGFSGDKTKLKKAVSATIAEERAKQHTLFASRLENLLTDSSFLEHTFNNSLDSRINHLVQEKIPEIKLDDIVLSADLRTLCDQIIQEHYRKELLRSYNLEPRNRILLIGPPGNGKTSLAEAIAESLMVPFLRVRYENIVGSYLGETASRLQNLMDYASTRKCVLFFDEFETLGKERGDIQETGEIKRVVSSLLVQIDALPSHVIVMGATNHPELLDRAAWRRFQVRMTLPQPTEATLIEWFERYQEKMKISLGYTAKALSQKMLGYNFSEIEEFGNSVFRHYVMNQPTSNIKQIVSHLLKQFEMQNLHTK